MPQLWLLKGGYDAPGWRELEKDSKAGEVNLIIFDRLAWALVEEDEAPTKYEGLTPERPASGVYVNPQGIPVYVVDGREVSDPRAVVASLGDEAVKLLEALGDPDVVLDRLGRAF